MPVLISLLRGVNIVGRNKIKMEALRALYEELGLTSVQSYIQSGNVVFRTSNRSLEALRKKLTDAIHSTFECQPFVMLRTLEEMQAAIEHNPFAHMTGEDKVKGSRLAVYFLSEKPDKAGLKFYRSLAAEGELVECVGRELYVYFSKGMGFSPLFRANIDKLLRTRATARNLNTVRKLVEMGERIAASERSLK